MSVALIDGLIAYWKLDEAGAGRADSHGANALTDNNTVGGGTGKINGAADFIAANSEYLSRADNADLSFADDAFTFDGWFKADSLATSSVLAKWASDGAVATCEYALRIVAGTSLNWRVGDGTANTDISHSTALSTATWYYFCVYHDPAANLIGISLDGGAFQTAAHSTGVLDGAAGFALGRTGDFAGQYYDGLIDEAGLWGRVLSLTEAQERYASGAGLAYPLGTGVGPPRRRRRLVFDPAFEFAW